MILQKAKENSNIMAEKQIPIRKYTLLHRCCQTTHF